MRPRWCIASACLSDAPPASGRLSPVVCSGPRGSSPSSAPPGRLPARPWLSETPRGGTITYSIKDEGEVLSSPARRDALALIEEKCGKDYRIVREGRVARVNQRADRIWQGQITEEMVWAVQFTCS
jgi:hypothetical protein